MKSSQKQSKRPAKPRSSATAVGEHLDMTRQRVVQFANEGVFKRYPDGTFDLHACRDAYLRWLRSPKRRVNQADAGDAFTDARRDEVLLRVRKLEDQLIDAKDVDELVADIKKTFAEELAKVPAFFEDHPELRQVIETQLAGCMNRMRDRFERAKRANWSADVVLDGNAG